MDLAALARERESRNAASRGAAPPSTSSPAPAAPSVSAAARRPGVATLSSTSAGRAQVGAGGRTNTRADNAADAPQRPRGTLDYLAAQIGVAGKFADVPEIPALGFTTRTRVPLINLIVLGAVAAALLYKMVDVLRVCLLVVAGLYMIVSQSAAARRDERAE
jgi:hypothetical protein